MTAPGGAIQPMPSGALACPVHAGTAKRPLQSTKAVDAVQAHHCLQPDRRQDDDDVDDVF